MKEIWRPVVGYEGLYEVSSWGCVRNVRTGRVLRPRKDIDDYMYVDLWKDGVPKTYRVHRLVAMAFADLVDWTEDANGKPFKELEINHKDKDRTNNRVENLEWCGRTYNVRYSQAKTVYQYTLDGELVRVWPSTRECEKYGFNYRCISACCNGKQETHKGFKWSYLPPSC